VSPANKSPLRMVRKHPTWDVTIVSGYKEQYGVGDYEILYVIDNNTGASVDHGLSSAELQFLTEASRIHHSRLADKLK